MTNKTLPWQHPPLDQWSICGMNHYNVAGVKFLFVSMVNKKNERCITSEGPDSEAEYIWNRLWHKASDHER